MREKLLNRRNLKNLLSLVLVFVMLVTLIPMSTLTVYGAQADSGYITNANGLMEYNPNAGNGYDFKGYVNGSWQQVTYNNRGFLAKIYNGTGLSVSATPEFVADGKAMKVTYKVKNNTQSTVSNYRFFIAADTMIAGNDASSNSVDADNVVTMTNQSAGISFFAFSITEGGTAVATEYNCGAVSYCSVNSGADPSTVVSTANASDSAFVMYFPKDTINSGEEKEYVFIVGMGSKTEINGIIDTVKKAVGIKIQYSNEKIIGLVDNTSYIISWTEDGERKSVTVTTDTNGQIPLIGTGISGGTSTQYNLLGKKIKIQDIEGGATLSNPIEVTIAGRPAAPAGIDTRDNEIQDIELDDVIETTTSSITIKAKDGQEYRINIDGTTWVKADGSGKVTFDSQLEPLTEYTIYTRKSATESAPASESSPGAIIKTQGMFVGTLTKSEYNGQYDGNIHTISVQTSVEDATIKYARELEELADPEGEWQTEPFSFKYSGTYDVYYLITKDNYYNEYGKLTVKIIGGHIFSYSVADNVITAKCSDNNCPYHEDGISLTLSASSEDYLGSEVSVNVGSTAQRGVWNALSGLIPLSNLNVKYYTSYTDEETNEPTTTSNSGASDDNAAPVYSGDYVAVLTVGTAPNSVIVKLPYTVSPTAAAPVIETQLEAQTVTEGAEVTYTVVATVSDSGSLSYQWEKQTGGAGAWTAIADATSDTYTLDSTRTSMSGDKYRCIVTNTNGIGNAKQTISDEVVLTVKAIVPAHTHTVVTDPAVAATCASSGKSAGSHCSSCGQVLTEQTDIPAKGHDFSGSWTISKEATATENGAKETSCKNGCGTKQVQTIPATGEMDKEEEVVEDEPFKDDPNAGKLDKAAEVAPEAPIASATLDNTKTDLVNNADIFTEEEKEAVKNGEDAKVWLEIDTLDQTSLPKEEVSKVETEAAKSLGQNSTVKYFDASLFKKVGSSDKTSIHEPGIEIKVTITIPSDMLNSTKGLTRNYKIIRVHDGVATVISGIFDKLSNEFSFKTDRFSTYAIAYSDVPTAVEKVTITKPASTTIDAHGKTLQLQAVVSPEDAVDKSLVWSSSDEKVATVNNNGLVTAVGNGSTLITASTADGKIKDSITITVNDPIIVIDDPVENNNNNADLTINEGFKVSQTGSSIKVKWSAVAGADGYLVYATYCGSSWGEPVKTTSKNSVGISKLNGKKLDLTKSFKIYVQAYSLVDGKEVILGKTITAHIVGNKNSKYTNVKSITIKSKTSLTLAVGETSKIKASIVLVDKKKKQLSDAHTSTYRYATTDSSVATVTKDGQIRAVGTGSCYVYVYAKNGNSKKIKITVK